MKQKMLLTIGSEISQRYYEKRNASAEVQLAQDRAYVSIFQERIYVAASAYLTLGYLSMRIIDIVAFTAWRNGSYLLVVSS
jgi:hypothetical protein